MTLLPGRAAILDQGGPGIVDGVETPHAKKWPTDADGFTRIPVCIEDGSSVGDWASLDFISNKEDLPTLDDVVARVRAALSYWESRTSIRFVGWETAAELDAIDPTLHDDYLHLYINEDADNNSYVGIQARGKRGTAATSFKPFGYLAFGIQPAGVLYDFGTGIATWTYDHAEQYAIHEVGHALGLLHEWRHPTTPVEWQVTGESALTGLGSLPLTDPAGRYIIPNASYDQESIMVYGTMANVTGVRFGNPIPNENDYQALAIAYPPVVSSVVQNTADSGPGSLRQAIADVPLAGDVITFAPELSGQSIELGTGELAIDKDLTIDASALAGGIVIDGANNSRLISVSAGNTVALKSLTLTRGNAGTLKGGGVFNEGNLTISQCTLRANQSSVVGGGVYNSTSGTLAVSASTFADNRSVSLFHSGGAIRNDGTLTVSQSTFTGNSANGGGAILSAAGSLLTVEQSTFSGNVAGFSGGGISLYATTGSQTLVNSIVAGNTPNDLYLAGGPGFTTEGNNLTDRDPLLAPLGDYGGLTPTMPPLPGSPAIDAAVMQAETPLTDQRGKLRPNGPLPDIGAVEAYPFSDLPLVDTDSDGIDDRLETGIFGDLSTAAQTTDTDGDGSSDLEEIANMTNPKDANDQFEVISFIKAAGFDPQTNPVFDLTIKTFPGLGYRVERQQDLAAPFVPFGDVIAADDFTQSVQVLLMPGKDFVRVRRE